RVVEAVTAVLPDAKEASGPRFRQLDGDPLQLTLSPGELSLTTPYWFEGPEAAAMVDQLRRVATAVEQATGLTAYDPQAGRAFLADGDREAAATFDRAAETLRQVVAERGTSRPTPRWAFWRR